MTKRTDTSILASAMYALARDIDSADGIANAAIFEAAERLELQQHEIDKLTASLGSLLAVIHRDGGHYLAEHGVEKACADAEAIVVSLRSEIARLQSIIDSRPAINAGLAEAYAAWSSGIYESEIARAVGLDS